ncbi:MAG: sulfotransferase domain-containing protein [Candidatus Handelsmanbacteria bacterium]|nr:sulfotransferase domain-containing protein [Candidatus Handelsmanbacteria bacterium]
MGMDEIALVSGLPRSGTSMMMKMLEAGGLEPLTDGQREADEDNLGGYYEFEAVKKVAQDPGWLEQARGRVVKVISRLLYDLPEGYSYRVVFMLRDLGEVLASQERMLQRRGRAEGGVADADLKRIFQRHLDEVAQWLKGRPNFSVLYLNYEEILAGPRPQAARVVQFLGNNLDTARMAAVVDQRLYRQRR